MKTEYALLVKSKTRLELLVERFNTISQAKFYIENAGGDFEMYLKEHQKFYKSFQTVQRQLTTILKNKVLEREFLPSYIFAENQIIVVVGQDGLVANVSKYSKGIPIIAVNPDEESYDGTLLPFHSKNFLATVKRVIDNNFNFRKMKFAEVQLQDGQLLLAVNDVFVGISTHASARYKISYEGKVEQQSSSGVIISTKTGSTGWLSSVFNMASGILNVAQSRAPNLAENELFFAVREPFKSMKTQIGICAGRLKKGQKLIIESQMPTDGIIFSDGVQQDFLQFNSGAIATIQLSQQEAVIVLP